MRGTEHEDIEIVVDEYCVWPAQPAPDAPVGPPSMLMSDVAVEDADRNQREPRGDTIPRVPAQSALVRIQQFLVGFCASGYSER
jgi:hypothetical protein